MLEVVSRAFRSRMESGQDSALVSEVLFLEHILPPTLNRRLEMTFELRTSFECGSDVQFMIVMCDERDWLSSLAYDIMVALRSHSVDVWRPS